MAELEGYVTGEATPRTVELVAGSETRLGKLLLELESLDIQIGAVEIKNGASDQRALVNADGSVSTDPTDRVGRLLGRTANYDVLVNGTLAAAEQTVEIAGEGLSTVGIGISGTWAGTIVVEGNVGDGVWATIPIIHSLTAAAAVATTGNGNWFIGSAGFLTVRVRMSAYTSGTATVYLEGSSAPAGVFLSRSIPTGGNLIGSVLLSEGTSTIGKLAANDGVDIGNVDVASVPAAMQGPGNPTVDSYHSIAINLAASTADQEIVSAPGANKQLWVYGIFMMADTAAGTVAIQDEDDAAYSGVMAVSDEGGWVLPLSGNFSMPWIKVATNKALEADTGACTIDGILCYAIVSV